MKKILFLFAILLTFLTACTGLDFRKMSKHLEENDCLYNEEYGIEINKLFQSCYGKGYITIDDSNVAVLVLWDCAIKVFKIYKTDSIDNINSEEDCFRYFDSEDSRADIIISGDLEYDDDIILTNIEGEPYQDIDQIILKAK